MTRDRRCRRAVSQDKSLCRRARGHFARRIDGSKRQRTQRLRRHIVLTLAILSQDPLRVGVQVSKTGQSCCDYPLLKTVAHSTRDERDRVQRSTDWNHRQRAPLDDALQFFTAHAHDLSRAKFRSISEHIFFTTIKWFKSVLYSFKFSFFNIYFFPKIKTLFHSWRVKIVVSWFVVCGVRLG